MNRLWKADIVAAVKAVTFKTEKAKLVQAAQSLGLEKFSTKENVTNVRSRFIEAMQSLDSFKVRMALGMLVKQGAEKGEAEAEPGPPPKRPAMEEQADAPPAKVSRPNTTSVPQTATIQGRNTWSSLAGSTDKQLLSFFCETPEGNDIEVLYDPQASLEAQGLGTQLRNLAERLWPDTELEKIRRPQAGIAAIALKAARRMALLEPLLDAALPNDIGDMVRQTKEEMAEILVGCCMPISAPETQPVPPSAVRVCFSISD